MKIPPYLKQQHNSACSLAVLRMVLASKDIKVSEEELIQRIEKDYKRSFKQVWNPTIAKLAREYGVPVTFIARWSLLKPHHLKKAIEIYANAPETFDVFVFEEKDLDIAYRDMLEAVRLGCITEYKKLTAENLKELLTSRHYVQTSIHKHKLYPDAKHGYHSILLYGYKDNQVYFHDPDIGAEQKCSLEHLMKALNGVGAALVYYI
jgi:ABC-type bacteriocin/lantibiotic exporter with double-glycine peptidase domain